jgi:hypothetical protein
MGEHIKMKNIKKTVIVVAAGLSIFTAGVASANTGHYFYDSGKWWTGAAEWAQENGLVSGYPDGTFGGDKGITRGEVVTILKNMNDKEFMVTKELLARVAQVEQRLKKLENPPASPTPTPTPAPTPVPVPTPTPEPKPVEPPTGTNSVYFDRLVAWTGNRVIADKLDDNLLTLTFDRPFTEFQSTMALNMTDWLEGVSNIYGKSGVEYYLYDGNLLYIHFNPAPLPPVGDVTALDTMIKEFITANGFMEQTKSIKYTSVFLSDKPYLKVSMTVDTTDACNFLNNNAPKDKLAGLGFSFYSLGGGLQPDGTLEAQWYLERVAN